MRLSQAPLITRFAVFYLLRALILYKEIILTVNQFFVSILKALLYTCWHWWFLIFYAWICIYIITVECFCIISTYVHNSFRQNLSSCSKELNKFENCLNFEHECIFRSLTIETICLMQSNRNVKVTLKHQFNIIGAF